LDESKVASTHFTASDMKRRQKVYHEFNNSKTAEPSVQQFFKEQGVQLFEKDANLEVKKIMDSIKIYIERNGKPRNFMHNDASGEAARRLRVEKSIMEKQEMERLQIIIEEGVEKELKKMKEKHIKDNLAAIKDEQNE
jgi:hypothetical protein